MNEEAQYIENLKQAVIDMEDVEAEKLAEEYIKKGYDIQKAINEGLIKGMDVVGELYKSEQYFIPDLLSSAEAMYAALEPFKETLKGQLIGNGKSVVIGTVLGDTHDIGKNIVACFMDSAGFIVHDVGRDVEPEVFVDKAVETNAEIIILSTIMTTTMENMRDVIELLKKRNLKDKIKVMVGGKPVSPRFAREIGADGYSVNAADAVKLARKLSGVISE